MTNKNNVKNNSNNSSLDENIKKSNEKVVDEINKTLKQKFKILNDNLNETKKNTALFLMGLSPTIIRIILLVTVFFTMIPLGIYLNLALTFFQYNVFIQLFILLILFIIMLSMLFVYSSRANDFVAYLDKTAINKISKLSDTETQDENLKKNTVKEISEDLFRRVLIGLILTWIILSVLIFGLKKYFPFQDMLSSDNTKKLKEVIKLLKNIEKNTSTKEIITTDV